MKLMIDTTRPEGTIAPEIYGHFSEHLGRGIYGGLFVGKNSDIPNVNGMRTDVVEALRALQVPVLRWPGGCFADEYHWMDGIGPAEGRKKMINSHWGGVTEDNSFGTHEFMEFCRQIGCKTYVNGNLGSGTVREMNEWVEYMTFGGISPMADLRRKNGREEPWQVDYFGIGNENWGCGGNMTPEFYGSLYRQYQTYVRNYDPAHPIKKVCCGPNVDDYHWTEGVLATCFDHTPPQLHGFMDLLSLHYYVHPEGWEIKGSATAFDEAAWYKTMGKALAMDTLIARHSAILDRYDPEIKIGLSVDEWGDWFTVEPGTNPGFLYQQNTQRDAAVAAITLNVFNKHCDRVKMACLAQMVNVLQAVLLTDGSRMIKTPTYHVLHMYRHHQGAALLHSELIGAATVGAGDWQMPAVTESVSVKDGIVTVTLANLRADAPETVELLFGDGAARTVTEARILTAELHAHNTFENPDAVCEKPCGCTVQNGAVAVTLPAGAVAELRLR